MNSRNVVATVIKLAVLSLIVGWLLSFFDLSPHEFLRLLGHTAEEIINMGTDAIRWSLSYILVGAMVVVPLWAVFALLGVASRKRGIGPKP